MLSVYQFNHPEAGYFQVSEHGNHPSGLPYFCCGFYYATVDDAVEDFYRRCEEDRTNPNTYPEANFDHDAALERRWD